MSAVLIGKGFIIRLIAGLTLLLAALPASAEKISDPRRLISFELPSGWISLPPGRAQSALSSLAKPGLSLVGVDPEKTDVLLINTSEAKDLIPHIQIAVHDLGGLSLSEAELNTLQKALEDKYSSKMGSRFKLLTLQRIEFNSLRAARITGIYRWRTNNIKLLQILLPGTEHLYEITYTAKEREFSRHLDAVEEWLGTVQIADPPLVLDWLWDWLGGLTLIFMLGAVFVLIIYIYTNRLGRPGLGPSDRTGTAVSPFMRKK